MTSRSHSAEGLEEALHPVPFPPGARIGVVDIGSSSVRMVVFDGAKRVPVPLYSEKVFCGLGSGLETSGVLRPEGVALALETLVRFAGLARVMDVAHLDFLATAAVRDARDRADFVHEVYLSTGYRVRVLTGAEEARFAALGVHSGHPAAHGFGGDLGGGSLELVDIEAKPDGPYATLPLGSLRLMDAANGSLDKARTLIDLHLRDLDWLDGNQSSDFYAGDFYAIGGMWRSLARMHMEQNQYPLRIPHGYSISWSQAEELTEWVIGRGGRSLDCVADLPKWRLEALPYAALLLQQVVRRVRPRRVVFTSFGLREGWVYSRLPAAERELDPLLALAREWAQRDGRFGDLGQPLAAWTAALFPQESAEQQHLRLVACHLSDIGWRYPPDYRAEHVLLRILRARELCVEHRERVFLAVTLYHRYGGERNHPAFKALPGLLDPAQANAAEVLGRALRLAWLICGGAGEMLGRTRLMRKNSTLLLEVPEQTPVPPGRIVERRLTSLAASLKLDDAKIVPAEGD